MPNRNNQRDVGNIARKWGLKFTGEKGQSIDVFLNRVEECRDLAKMSEEEMLSSLSELFAGVAATWYQNNKANWSTWNEFCASARKWYGANRRFQQRILQEATARTQGKEEPVRDFITCLLSILKKIEPPLPLAHQLDTLHRNLRPDLQRMVRRVDFDDIDTLLELSVEAELTIEAEKSYREPPPPEHCLVPEAAYKPRGNKEKQAPLKVSAFPTSNPPATGGEGQSWIATLSKMLAQEVKLALQPTLTNAQPPPPSLRSSSPKKKKKGAGGEKSERAGDSPRRESRPRQQERKKSPDSSAAKPKGSSEGIHCYGCGLPGYRTYNCPKCAGNGKTGA